VLSAPPGPPIALPQDYQSYLLYRKPFLYDQIVGSDLVSIVEVAEMLGVSRQRVHQILRAYPDFPEPEAELAVGRIWRRQPIADWMASHPRSTGRPRKSDIPPTAATRPTQSDDNGPPSGGAGVSGGARSPRRRSNRTSTP
jgi:hypothetical protein